MIGGQRLGRIAASSRDDGSAGLAPPTGIFRSLRRFEREVGAAHSVAAGKREEADVRVALRQLGPQLELARPFPDHHPLAAVHRRDVIEVSQIERFTNGMAGRWSTRHLDRPRRKV